MVSFKDLEHRTIHAHEPSSVLACPAEPYPAAHIRLMGHLRSHPRAPAHRSQRFQHGLRPAGAHAGETFRGQEWSDNIRDESTRAFGAVLGCRVDGHAE